jgi:hypothetical protein
LVFQLLSRLSSRRRTRWRSSRRRFRPIRNSCGKPHGHEDGTSFKQLVVRGRPALLTETPRPIFTDRVLAWAEGTDTIVQVVSPFLDEAALLAIAQGVEMRWSDNPPIHATLDPLLCARLRSAPHDISENLLAEAEKAMGTRPGCVRPLRRPRGAPGLHQVRDERTV